MLKYTLQRILYMLLVFTVITFMCFVLIRMLPPLPLDPMRPETLVVEARREAMGYNKPYIEQFGIFVKNVVTKFNWGVSEKLYYGPKVPHEALKLEDPISQSYADMLRSPNRTVDLMDCHDRQPLLHPGQYSSGYWPGYLRCSEEKLLGGLSDLHRNHGLHFRAQLRLCIPDPVLLQL